MRVFPILWVCLIASLTTHAVAFDGVTNFLGGPGGGRHEDACNFDAAHAEYALVAIDYVSGKDIDRVTAVCAVVRSGQPDAYTMRLDTHGMNNDNGAQRVSGNVSCPQGMLVQAIHVTESAVLLVHHFWLTCRNPFTGQKKDTGESGTFGGAGGAPGYYDCGDDSYASGLRVRSDAMINALGLICTTYHPPAPPPPPVVNNPAPPPPPPPKPKPDKPPLKINNGDDQSGIVDNGNTGERAATASTDTTIYDQPEGNEIDYLSAGDPVTITDCDQSNWCRISKPRKGWVWGDDLSR